METVAVKIECTLAFSTVIHEAFLPSHALAVGVEINFPDAVVRITRIVYEPYLNRTTVYAEEL